MKTDTKVVKGGATSKKRGNVLDLLILLVLLAAIFAIGYRYYTLSEQGKSELLEDASLSFEIKDAIFTLPSYINPEDAVYLSDGTLLGTVQDNNSEDENTALYFTAATVITTDGDGNFIRVSYPDSSRVDCLGTLHCLGTFGEDGSFMLGGTLHLTPGQVLTVHTETATFTMTLTACTKMPVK